MKRTFWIALALGAVTQVAGAQGAGVDTQCGTATPNAVLPADLTQNGIRDVCQKAIDLYRYMFPQLGTSIAGGNATLGQGGSLGGFPHFALGFRVNGVVGTLPQVDKITPDVQNGTNSGPIPTTSQTLPMPVVDAAIGIFAGLPVGLTNIGGVDLLINASYLPEFTNGQVSVKTPSGRLKVGYGARIGLLQESLLVPGLSVSYIRRDLPTVDIIGTTSPAGTPPVPGTLAVTKLVNKVGSFRVTASKTFITFGLAAGIGRDTYEGSSTIVGTHNGQSRSASVGQTMTRANLFADGYFDLGPMKLVGEIGMASGGTMQTYNTFVDKKADDSRVYGSAGVRFGF
ncbi:MAG: hypothetical protein NVS9B3_10420 [Gemmatimonadaceae bacterium]